FWINVGTKGEPRNYAVLLEGVQVDCARRGLLQIVVFRVAHHSHNLVGRCLIGTQSDVVQGHITSDGAVPAEVAASHSLINDCDERSSMILKQRVATGDEWCAIGFKIIRRNEVDGNLAV